MRWCCPAAFLVPLSNIRADVGGLNKSTANLTALAQPPSDCALKAAQEAVPPSLVSEEKRSTSRTRFLSPTQQLTRQEHVWEPESLPGCWGGEVLRTLLAQSGHFLSIRKSGSGLCYPSVRKATEQLSINYFWEECRSSWPGTGLLWVSVCSIKQSCSSAVSTALSAWDSSGCSLCCFLLKPCTTKCFNTWRVLGVSVVPGNNEILLELGNSWCLSPHQQTCNCSSQTSCVFNAFFL